MLTSQVSRRLSSLLEATSSDHAIESDDISCACVESIDINTAELLYTVTSDVSVNSPTVDSDTLSSTYTLQTLAL